MSGKVIFVLGMHRSGTSAAARLLNILGVDFGTNLREGHPDINAKGFWENKELIEIHERILAGLDSAWFDGRPLPNDWWMDPKVLSYGSEIERVLERDFENQSLFAVKDPRLCRLLPLWREIARKLGISPTCLLVLRNPLEVSRSLAKRDGFDAGAIHALWLTYVLESEYNSRGLLRSVVTYDEILSDWQSAASRIADHLGIQWSKSTANIDDTVAEEILLELRHHHVEFEDSGDMDALTVRALGVYAKITGGNLADSKEYFDQIRLELTELEPISEALVGTLYRTHLLLTERSKALIEMGDKHSHTLEVIAERDRQIEELGREHTCALEVIAERDRQIEELGREHTYALEVIAERDRQLNKIRSHWLWPIARYFVRGI